MIGLGDIEVNENRCVSEGCGQRRALVVEYVTDDHLGALGNQQSGVLGAHSTRATADQRDFAVYTSHAGHASIRLYRNPDNCLEL